MFKCKLLASLHIKARLGLQGGLIEAILLSVQSSFHKTFAKIVQVVPETLLCCRAIFCCWFLMFASLEVVAGITESAKFSFPVSVVEDVTDSSLLIFFGGVGGLHLSSSSSSSADTESSTTNV